MRIHHFFFCFLFFLVSIVSAEFYLLTIERHGETFTIGRPGPPGTPLQHPKKGTYSFSDGQHTGVPCYWWVNIETNIHHSLFVTSDVFVTERWRNLLIGSWINSQLGQLSLVTPEVYYSHFPPSAPEILIGGTPATQDEIDYFDLEEGVEYDLISANYSDSGYFNQSPVDKQIALLLHHPNGHIIDTLAVYTVLPGETVTYEDYGFMPEGYFVIFEERDRQGFNFQHDPELHLRDVLIPSPTGQIKLIPNVEPVSNPSPSGPSYISANPQNAHVQHLTFAAPNLNSTPEEIAESARQSFAVSVGVSSLAQDIVQSHMDMQDQMFSGVEYAEPEGPGETDDQGLSGLSGIIQGALSLHSSILAPIIQNVNDSYDTFQTLFSPLDVSGSGEWVVLPSGVIYDNAQFSISLGAPPFSGIKEFIRAIFTIVYCVLSLRHIAYLMTWAVT